MTTPAGTAHPGLVFAPARPRICDGRKDVVFEMRKQPDGALMLPVFSSVDGLVQQLGRHQPWACVPLPQMLAALGGGRVAQIVIDPQIAARARRWTPDGLAQPANYKGRHAIPALSEAGSR